MNFYNFAVDIKLIDVYLKRNWGMESMKVFTCQKKEFEIRIHELCEIPSYLGYMADMIIMIIYLSYQVK